MTCSQLFNILENLHITRLYHFFTTKFPAVKRFVMTSNHGENESDRYWCVIRMHQFGIRYDEFSQSIIRHISIFMWSPRDTSSRERHPRPLAGRLFYRPCLRSLNIATKMQAAQMGLWSSLPGEWLHHRIRAIVQSEGSHTPYQRSYCYTVSFVTCPRLDPYVDVFIWSCHWAGNKYATFCIIFALI